MNAADHVHAFFGAWATNDAETIGRFYATDAVMEDPTLTQPRQGRDAIVRYYRDMFSALEHPSHDLLDWAARDNRVWFEWTFGSGGSVRPREDYHGVSIQSFCDGLIVHDEAFWLPRV